MNNDNKLKKASAELSSRNDPDLRKAADLIAKVANREYQKKHIFMTEKDVIAEVDRLTKVDNPTVKDFAKYTKHFILTKFMDIDGFLKKVAAVILIGGPAFIMCFAVIASVLVMLINLIPLMLLSKILTKHQDHLRASMVRNNPNLAAYNVLLDDIKRGRIVVIKSEDDKNLIKVNESYCPPTTSWYI